MWKHKTKWLVRGGRKVRCYLCGKKILAQGDLFLFHGDTGYYSHQSCMTESNTISGNERRRAVKKIAVGAAIVGAIAAGAGKLIDISSQSKGSNSPAAQTILTSQGLILPALTSDPANPVPGQMWYRSDKGVTAHFDAIENRVIYSNRIVNGSIVITSKGISNGLSVLPNDGQDWGPDTTLNATAPGHFGSPYTQTSGLQEGFNFAGTKARYSAIGFGYVLPEIRLLDGKFLLNANVNLPSFPSATYSIPSFSIIGNGYGFAEGGTLLAGNLDNFYNINIGTTSGAQMLYGGFLIQGLNLNYINIIAAGNYEGNPQCIIRDVGVHVSNIDFSNAYGIAQINLDNVFDMTSPGGKILMGGAYQMSATNLTAKGGLYLGNASNSSSGGATSVNQVGVVNLAEGIEIDYGNTSVDITEWELDNNGTNDAGSNGITNNVPSGDTFTLNVNVGTMIINNTSDFFVTVSGAGTLNIKMHVKHLVFLDDVNDWTVPSGINIQEFTVDEITNFTSTATSSANLPIISSTAGTTAGTVSQRFTEYASSHKKLYVTFSGYENDTTTNQVISFPLSFSNSAIIVGNNTGLTITATTTGITITSPDSTTAYSGIVIIEGY